MGKSQFSEAQGQPTIVVKMLEIGIQNLGHSDGVQFCGSRQQVHSLSGSSVPSLCGGPVPCGEHDSDTIAASPELIHCQRKTSVVAFCYGSCSRLGIRSQQLTAITSSYEQLLLSEL